MSYSTLNHRAPYPGTENGAPEETMDATFSKARNVDPCTLSQAQNVLLTSFLVQLKLNKRSTVVNLEGEAGIGKTQGVYQVADQLSTRIGAPVHVINWKLMSREKEDVGGYPRPSEVQSAPVRGGGSLQVTTTVPCFEYAPEKILAEIQISGDPAILFFDEWPRADKSVCAVMFGAIEDGQLGSFNIPMNWFIVTASNPDSGYQHNGLVSDHAYRRRMAWLAVAYNYAEFLTHIKGEKYHQAVVHYCGSHPSECLDVQAREQGFVYANPAAWEKISDYMTAMDTSGQSLFEDAHTFRSFALFCGGLIGKDIAKTFTSFARKFLSEITADDIMYNYTEDKQACIESLKQEGRNDVLSALCEAVFTRLWTLQEPLDSFDKVSVYIDDTTRVVNRDILVPSVVYNVSDFVYRLPMDIAAAGITCIELTTPVKAYMEKFGRELVKVPKWREFQKKSSLSEHIWKSSSQN